LSALWLTPKLTVKKAEGKQAALGVQNYEVIQAKQPIYARHELVQAIHTKGCHVLALLATLFMA